MIDSYFNALKNGLNFRGRARRREFWTFYLANWGILFLLVQLAEGVHEGNVESPLVLSAVLFLLLMIVPMIAAIVRRLHDTDRSGFWLLINLVPLLGFLILVVMWSMDGTVGPNRFGSDPKGRLSA